MPAKISAIAAAAFVASVTGASAQFSAYAEPGFGYTPERPLMRSRAAYPHYRWVDPRTGQPYNLAVPAYCAATPDRRTDRC